MRINFYNNLYPFRFCGRIAEKGNLHDEETLEAIKCNISGLEKISGERIWSELKKILQGNCACDLVINLLNCGAAKYIGNFTMFVVLLASAFFALPIMYN